MVCYRYMIDPETPMNTSSTHEHYEVKFTRITDGERASLLLGATGGFMVDFGVDIANRLPKQTAKENTATLQSENPEAQPLSGYAADNDSLSTLQIGELGGAFVIGAVLATALNHATRRVLHRRLLRKLDSGIWIEEGLDKLQVHLAEHSSE
jgi:hypothetical protein